MTPGAEMAEVEVLGVGNLFNLSLVELSDRTQIE